MVERLRDLFPRHHLQDTFMHTATIVAFVVAVIGFIFGFFPPVAYIGVDWLLFAIALLLFLMLRESTLSHLRGRNRRHDEATGGRYHAAREQQPPAAVPGEAATAQPSQPRKT